MLFAVCRVIGDAINQGKTMTTAFRVQGGKLIRDLPRPPQDIVAGLGRVSTSILSDCLDRLNAMNSVLQPIAPGKTFAGPAFTVEEMEGGNLMSHLALKFLQAGDVLVIDGKGVTTRAGWGGLQTLAAQRKGAAAVIIDGAVRDRDEIFKLGLPVYARAVTPAGPHKGWAGRVNLPVSCGGVVVHAGDVIVGDGDGVVVVPREQATPILEKARERLRMEQDWFRRVEAGENTADFLGMTELAAKYGVEII
jgi:regulator of RNase E activity RraA